MTCLLMLFSLKMFPLLERVFQSVYGIFYLYGGVTLLLLPLIMFVLPETKVWSAFLGGVLSNSL